jgi:hypothetical protein
MLHAQMAAQAPAERRLVLEVVRTNTRITYTAQLQRQRPVITMLAARQQIGLRPAPVQLQRPCVGLVNASRIVSGIGLRPPAIECAPPLDPPPPRLLMSRFAAGACGPQAARVPSSSSRGRGRGGDQQQPSQGGRRPPAVQAGQCIQGVFACGWCVWRARDDRCCRRRGRAGRVRQRGLSSVMGRAAV